jgi:hypothetical protein
MKRKIEVENKNSNVVELSSTLLKLRPVSLAVRVSLLGVGLACGVANAAEIIVNSDDDSLNTNSGSTCTLRKAVQSIKQQATKPGCVNTGDAFGTNDTIEFAPAVRGNTITLAGAEMVINGGRTPLDLTLRGSNVTINPNANSRAFKVDSENSLTINDLTISNGSEFFGGAVFIASNAELTGNNVTLSNNNAESYGGAIAAGSFNANNPRAIITLNSSSMSGNRAGFAAGAASLYNTNASFIDSKISNNTVTGPSGGGGLNLNGGRFVLNRVTMDSNESSAFGGALFFNPSSNAALYITDSTISNNTASITGGGLELNSGQNSVVIITNSTISSNTAGRLNGSTFAASGGGVLARGVGYMALKNTTVFNNASLLPNNVPTGAYAAGIEVTNNGALKLVNTIVAGSVGAGDCDVEQQATITADQFNIIQDGSCATSAQAVNPRLKPLADNGGNTKTHLPTGGSPAIDGGDNRTCQASDQRGGLRSRVTSNACDVGAVEVDEEESEQEGSFFVVPTKNGKAVIFEL